MIALALLATPAAASDCLPYASAAEAIKGGGYGSGYGSG